MVEPITQQTEGDIDTHMVADKLGGTVDIINSPNINRESVAPSYETVTEVESLDDGSPLYTSTFVYPSITIKDNAAASNEIMKHIKEAEVNFFSKREKDVELVRKHYGELEGDSLTEFAGFGNYLTYEVLFSCDNFISLMSEYTCFTENTLDDDTKSQAYTFNAKTGERLELADLFTDY